MRLTLTQEEADMAAYALREMGNKTLEQAWDWRDVSLRAEAARYHELAARVTKSLRAPAPVKK